MVDGRAALVKKEAGGVGEGHAGGHQATVLSVQTYTFTQLSATVLCSILGVTAAATLPRLGLRCLRCLRNNCQIPTKVFQTASGAQSELTHG